MQPDQLIAELLARGDMNEDTTADLNRMLADWQASRLDPDDEAYIQALHARLTGQPADAPAAASDGPRLDGLTIAEWRDRALKAEADLARFEEAARAG